MVRLLQVLGKQVGVWWPAVTAIYLGDRQKRGAWGTHTRRSFLQINLSCTSGITSLVNWSVD